MHAFSEEKQKRPGASGRFVFHNSVPAECLLGLYSLDATKSQFTKAQNDSTYFGLALR